MPSSFYLPPSAFLPLTFPLCLPLLPSSLCLPPSDFPSVPSPSTFLPLPSSLYLPLLPSSLYLPPSTFLPLPSSLYLPPSAFLLPSSLCLPPSAFLPLPSSFYLPPSAFLLLPSSLCLPPSTFLPLPSSLYLPPSCSFYRFLVVDPLLAELDLDTNLIGESASLEILDGLKQRKEGEGDCYIGTVIKLCPLTKTYCIAKVVCAVWHNVYFLLCCVCTLCSWAPACQDNSDTQDHT